MIHTNPSLRHLPIFSTIFANIDNTFSHFNAFSKRQVDRRIAENVAGKGGGREEDFLDIFIDEMDKAKGNNGDSGENTTIYNIQNLLFLCFDLWVAGFVCFIQFRLFNEIGDVLGP